MTRRLLPTALAAGLLLSGGCARDEYAKLPVVPAEGRVLYQGKPTAGAEVTLLPVGDDSPDAIKPRGRVNAEGVYKLSTYPTADGRPDGAPPGEYLVAVRWPSKSGRADDGDEGGGPPGPPGLRGDRLKERYSHPKKSGIVVRVEPGKPIETINLK